MVVLVSISQIAISIFAGAAALYFFYVSLCKMEEYKTKKMERKNKEKKIKEVVL